MKGATINKHIGKIARDKITGFTGTITGFCQYITGCDQYLLTPEGKTPSDYPKGTWGDVNRLSIVGNTKVTLDSSVDKGPCEMAPIK